MRLIDADDLIKVFEKIENDNSFPTDVRYYAIGAQHAIKKAPTTEPTKALENEKPQGEWEKPFLHSDGRWYHKCTNCRICSEVSILQNKYCNFCPNCGADMRRDG